MHKNQIVRDQFDRQARNFDIWPVTRNSTVLQSLYDFCGLRSGDRMLDVACGTGAFANFAARRVKTVNGVDLSAGMIDIARRRAKEAGLLNIHYDREDVELLPFEDNRFTTVVSKAAFHHMPGYKAVFSEMVRCCEKGGRICLEDIVLYADEKADTFFEDLEKEIDASHHHTLSKLQIYKLYKTHGIRIERMFESTPRLHFDDYVDHAVQSPESRAAVYRMLARGLEDGDLSAYLPEENRTRYWRRNVVTVVGRK